MTGKAIAILALVGFILVVAFGAEHFGHSRGVNQQKAIDQIQFDAINQKLTDQKTEAAAKYKQLSDDLIAKQQLVDEVKTNLEKKRAKDQATILALRDDLASRGLRFAASSESTSCGNRGGSPEGQADAPLPATTTIVELPAKITVDLRQLTFDADELKANYQKCYEWVNDPVNQ